MQRVTTEYETKLENNLKKIEKLIEEKNDLQQQFQRQIEELKKMEKLKKDHLDRYAQ